MAKPDPKAYRHVLVVENEPLMRDLLARAVESAGFVVTTAANAADAKRAMKTLERGWAVAPHPDLAELYLRASGESDPLKRLEMAYSFMEGELGVLQVERRIRGRVKRQMEKTQREYYLNEQLKAIQNELGGGDGEDDNEWGEWFEANEVLPTSLVVAPAPGNHEYFEEFEDTPQERRVLGAHWPVTFALPGNGVAQAKRTTYWFDYQDVRVVVIDGTSALDLGTAKAQAAWLDQALASNPHRWSIVLTHQPFFSPREGRDNVLLRQHLLPVIRKRKVDLVLQGHDHVYGRRLPGDAPTPVFVVSVAGAKQYRLSEEARKTMRPVAEDTQLFQVVRFDGPRLRYEARTATGRLYDAFDLVDDGPAGKHLVEHAEGRIDERTCTRAETLKGRADRCWE